MTYAQNKIRAVFKNTKPTKTDQAAADESNINIIVGQQLITGYAPGAPKPPMYEDFTDFPTDLREAIETARATKRLRAKLPPQLADKPMQELLALTPEAITTILTPPEPPAKEPPAKEPPKEPPK